MPSNRLTAGPAARAGVELESASLRTSERNATQRTYRRAMSRNREIHLPCHPSFPPTSSAPSGVVLAIRSETDRHVTKEPTTIKMHPIHKLISADTFR